MPGQARSARDVLDRLERAVEKGDHGRMVSALLSGKKFYEPNVWDEIRTVINAYNDASGDLEMLTEDIAGDISRELELSG
jgi:hypothetical protein